MKKIFLIFTMIAMVSFVSAQERALVNVNGEHIIMVKPDQAEVNFMVSTKHKNLQQAKKENDETIAKAIKYLKREKINDKDILTTRVNVTPYNEYVKDEKPIQMF